MTPDSVENPIHSGDAAGAGEALAAEHILLLFCEAMRSCSGRNLTEARLIVAIANEIYLYYVNRDEHAILDSRD
jgi:hypothetical protein